MPVDLGIPGYEWQATIGRGGFGIVHRARDLAHGRDVAIKVLIGDFSESAMRRFDRERRAMGAVSTHPNIAAVYTSGFTTGGLPYLVMPLLTGGSYAERLAQGPLPVDEVLEVGIAIADAVHVAHESSILHCDIKPANILRSSYGTPVLTDFGIANLLNDTAIASGIAASPAYAAPEVLRGETATTRSDVYSLGASLFSLLQGDIPFARSTDQSPFVVINRVLSDPPPVITRAGVPDALRTSITAAMDKDPAKRPASMASLRDTLRGALTGPVPVVVTDAPGAETVPGLDLLDRSKTPDLASGADAAPDADAVADEPDPLPVVAPAPPRRRGRVLVGTGAIAAAVVAVVAIAAASGGDEQRTATTGPSSTASPEATTTLTSTSAPTTTTAATSTTVAPTTTEAAPTTQAAPAPARPAPAFPIATIAETPPATQGTTPVTPPPATPPPATPAPNNAPTLALSPRTSDEQQGVNVALAAADPDGDPVTLTVSGLPPGLTVNGTTVAGTIRHDAANVTTNWRQSILSASFEVMVIATDGRGGSTTSSFTWTVRDTHLLMPNYIDRYGNGSDGLPNVAALSAQLFSCAFDPAGDDSRVFRQSVAPGTIIAWGQSITYWYGRNDPSCQTVAKGW